MAPLTPNEAVILAAIAGAVIAPLLSIVTSILTTRYTLKHGPNYERQIDDLHHTFQQQIGTMNESLNALSETQGELLRQQGAFEEAAALRRAADTERQEAARWKPEGRLQSAYEGSELKNELILKSPQEFTVLEVGLMSSTGAKLADVPIMSAVTSTGFRVHIRHSQNL